jgi:hypothetical protein
VSDSLSYERNASEQYHRVGPRLGSTIALIGVSAKIHSGLPNFILGRMYLFL